MDGYDLDAIDPSRPETYVHLPYRVVRAAAEKQRVKREEAGEELSAQRYVTLPPERAPGSLTVSEAIRTLLDTQPNREQPPAALPSPANRPAARP